MTELKLKNEGLDDDLDIDWEEGDYEQCNYSFAKEIYDLFSSFIETENINESFKEKRSLQQHFQKHCIGTSNKKSSKTNVVYDFTNINQYKKYENFIFNKLHDDNLIIINSLGDVELITNAFRVFFEGNKTLLFDSTCGFNNNGKSINLLLYSYSTDVTKNYPKNTVTLDVVSKGITRTLYPIDANYLEVKLNNIINRYTDNGLEIKINNPKEGDKNMNDLDEEIQKKTLQLQKKYLNAYIPKYDKKTGLPILPRSEYKDWDCLEENIESLYLKDNFIDNPIISEPEYTDGHVLICPKDWEEGWRDCSLNEKIEKHDELNPLLFENDELKPEVKDTVEKIASQFISDLKADGVKFDLLDIVLVGSNVSYNYTKDSDLDIHLIASSKNLKCPDDLYPLLYSAYRSIFNAKYDLTIKGIPTEIYVEMDKPTGKSNGVYSIYDGWLKHPTEEAIPDIDQEAFDKLFNEWEDKYFELLDSCDNQVQTKETINETLDFDSFINSAGVILVDNAFDFDINSWEQENQKELEEELDETPSEQNNKVSPKQVSKFKKYSLTPDKIKHVVDKIIKSDFTIVDYWKTNQFKKKNNLTDEDLKNILRTITDKDYKTNSVAIDNTKNEAIIFIKNINIKTTDNIKVYIKLDYDSIEDTSVIVISFHNYNEKRKKHESLTGFTEEIKNEDINDELDDTVVQKIDEFIESLYDLRKESIAKDGEYGLGNLVFKEFRNLGYLDNLKDIKTKLIDKELSLESVEK